MYITAKGHNALKAMINLASNGKNGPIALKKIALEEDVTEDFMLQILYGMKKTGIVRTTRGPNGGYSLGADPSRITLRMILESSGECVSMAPCAGSTNIKCRGTKFCAAHTARHDSCAAQKVWKDLTEILDKELEKITLDSILESVQGRQ